jgi:ElaB/YqjD/DUF883 family membrane-anchored ribosome-binding protein
MAVCLKPFGEEVARGAQFIEPETDDTGAVEEAVEEIAERWHRTSNGLHRFARENPGAALGAGLAAGVLIGVFLGKG